MRKRTHVLLCMVLFASLSFSREDPEGHVFSLDSALETAIQENPLAKVSLLEIQKANLEVKKARQRRFIPRLDFDLKTGLVSGPRGDAPAIPEGRDVLEGWGPFVKLNLGLVEPIYTFGKLRSATEAREHLLEMTESNRDNMLEMLSMEVVKAYWGLSSTIKAVSLSGELREKYDELVTEVQKRLEDEESEVDDTDLLEVQTFFFNIEEIYLESQDLKALSLKTFNMLLDRDFNDPVSTSDEPPPEFGLDENHVDDILEMAEAHRTELRAANAGIRALEAKTRLERSERLPVVFLAGGFRFAYAPHRKDELNPYAYDEWNHLDVGAFIGMKWDPNLFQHDIEIEQSMIEYEAALKKKQVLKGKIDLEVNQAFMDVRKNEALLKAARKSLKAAKTWLRISSDNWDMGIGELRRVREAYQAYYRLLGIEIERENEYNVSLARLAYVLGDIHLYVKWVQNGKVLLN